LAWERGPYHGDDVGEGEDRFEDEGADAVDYDDGLFVDGGDGRYHCEMVLVGGRLMGLYGALWEGMERDECGKGVSRRGGEMWWRRGEIWWKRGV
jgi:hypothetical protein